MVFVKVVVSPNGRGGKGVGRRESAMFDEIKYQAGLIPIRSPINLKNWERGGEGESVQNVKLLEEAVLRCQSDRNGARLRPGFFTVPPAESSIRQRNPSEGYGPFALFILFSIHGLY